MNKQKIEDKSVDAIKKKKKKKKLVECKNNIFSDIFQQKYAKAYNCF